MSNTKERRSLLSSQARIQAPWIKVTIGNYTFGVFDRKTKEREKNASGNYESYNITYPNYVQSLNIIKINGQINQYTLRIDYPVKFNDDPNFFEKVFYEGKEPAEEPRNPRGLFREKIFFNRLFLFSMGNTTLSYSIKI